MTSSCLELTGEMNISAAGLGCSFAPIAGSLEVAGSWVAHSDGSYVDLTTTTGEAELMLDAQCKNISGFMTLCERLGATLRPLGFASATCEDAANDGCRCLAQVEQTGSFGVVSLHPSTNGVYAVLGNELTAVGPDSAAAYQYCASGDTLTLMPEAANVTTVGSIVFEKQ